MSFPKTPWAESAPVVCDMCKQVLANCHAPGADPSTTFVDGQTVMGSWAIMGEGCFPIYGVGLGTGKGQRFNIETGEKLEG